MQVNQPEVIVVDGRDGLFNRDCEEKSKLTGFALGSFLRIQHWQV